jgi:ATP-dependent Lon protease
LERYLNKYRRVTELKIHKKNTVGVMNGLWANSLGNGGIIPIETMYFPSELFLELKLTGLQGDVMKESMNVAKTLVWSLCTSKQKTFILKNLKNSKTQGIHIHCPEGSVSKDGPSAGAAIVTSIFSLLNNIPIKHNVAMTGEISLQGNITAIGGLEQKITGGIRAGITHFLFPEENLIDFKLFLNKMTEQQLIKNESDIIHDTIHKKYMITISEKEILCTYISTISEVFPHVFL